MISYEETRVGPQANCFVRDYLTYGHALDSRLKKCVALNAGTVTAYLPSGIPRERVLEFTEGGVADPAVSEIYLARTIREFLTAAQGRVCLFEDPVLRPTDPPRLGSNVQRLTLNDEVYYYLNSLSSEDELILQTIREADYPNYFLCILTSVPGDAIFPISQGQLGDEELDLLIGRTEKIVIGAYDDEGYLVWDKSENG